MLKELLEHVVIFLPGGKHSRLKRFLRLMMLAILIASPLTYYTYRAVWPILANSMFDNALRAIVDERNEELGELRLQREKKELLGDPEGRSPDNDSESGANEKLSEVEDDPLQDVQLEDFGIDSRRRNKSRERFQTHGYTGVSVTRSALIALIWLTYLLLLLLVREAYAIFTQEQNGNGNGLSHLTEEQLTSNTRQSMVHEVMLTVRSLRTLRNAIRKEFSKPGDQLWGQAVDQIRSYIESREAEAIQVLAKLRHIKPVAELYGRELDTYDSVCQQCFDLLKKRTYSIRKNPQQAAELREEMIIKIDATVKQLQVQFPDLQITLPSQQQNPDTQPE